MTFFDTAMCHKQEKRRKSRAISSGQKLALSVFMQVQTDARQAVYKDHTIVHTVRRWRSSDKRAEYMAVAFISWKMPDRRRRVMHCLTLSKSYATVEEATNAARGEATKWVDQHVLFEL
jgi:hypothetical protein